MKILVRVMFWLDVAVIGALFVMPITPELWVWGVSLVHLCAAGWMWHAGYFDTPDYQQMYELECAAHRTHQEAHDKVFRELYEDYQRVIELWKMEEERSVSMCKLFHEYYYSGFGPAKRYVDHRAVN